MPAPSSILRAARPAFRAAANANRSSARTAGRRFQSTSTEGAAQQGQQQGGQQGPGQGQQKSWFSKMWDSPVGIKTVHFWAPVMKWSLVLAGVSDFARPAEKLSVTQNGALTATGLIWTRWCFVIRPQNILLAAVNFFLAGVGITQLTRIFLYTRSQNQLPPASQDEVARVEAEAAKVEAEVKAAAKKA